jgi:hypothetical protein
MTSQNPNRQHPNSPSEHQFFRVNGLLSSEKRALFITFLPERRMAGQIPSLRPSSDHNYPNEGFRVLASFSSLLLSI